MATFETAWKKSDGPVLYHGGERTVELGDRIRLRGLIRRRLGRINYVPGISEPHAEMEHNALYWVGIAFDNGTFTGIVVDPDTGWLLPRVEFLERGSPEEANPLPEAPFE